MLDCITCLLRIDAQICYYVHMLHKHAEEKKNLRMVVDMLGASFMPAKRRVEISICPIPVERK